MQLSALRTDAEAVAYRIDVLKEPVYLDETLEWWDIWLSSEGHVLVGDENWLRLYLTLGRLRRQLRAHLDRVVNDAALRLFGHDEQCESEFIEGPMLMSPCGCGDRARYPLLTVTL